MATVDLTQGAVATSLVSENDTGKQIFIQRTRDFGVSANSVNPADILQMIPVPAGFFALGALLETQTVEWGTTTQCQLGDGVDTDGWLGTVNCDLSSTITSICNSTAVYGALNNGRGKYYPVADTIDLIPNNTLNNAKVRVGVWGFMAKPGDSIAQ